MYLPVAFTTRMLFSFLPLTRYCKKTNKPYFMCVLVFRLNKVVQTKMAFFPLLKFSSGKFIVCTGALSKRKIAIINFVFTRTNIYRLVDRFTDWKVNLREQTGNAGRAASVNKDTMFTAMSFRFIKRAFLAISIRASRT